MHLLMWKQVTEISGQITDQDHAEMAEGPKKRDEFSKL